MRDQEEANACLEVAAATKKKRVGELWVRIFGTAKFFTTKFPLNTSPTPSGPSGPGGSGPNQAAHRGDYTKKLILQEQFGVKMKF